MLTPEDFTDPDRAVVSGAMHYFRTLPQQWPHRLRMLRAMGATCVETYVPWNLHERRRGEFDFDGLANLEGFLTESARAGLSAIVRPGPYICAEWDNGGLPAWLRGPYRCTDSGYLSAVDSWFEVLIPKIAQHQHGRGGNVIAVQIENEYGSYGSDKSYLEHLASSLRRHGITVPLFTSDGPTDSMLTAGTLPGALATANFGSRAPEAFATLEAHRPGEAKWCMEFWNGWFDHWGEKHHVRDASNAASDLDEMLESGASVNIYMAHGGTNFGTWAGANHEDGYQPTITSYDYDSPISESGEATEKYHAFRQVIAKYEPVDAEIPEPEPTLAPTTVNLDESLSWWHALGGCVDAAMPPSFSRLGIDNGLVLYRHRLRGPREPQPLTLDGLADRAQIFVDGTEKATMERNDPARLELSCDAEGADLDLLVESNGRVNFGQYVGEDKGTRDAVRLGRQTLHGWSAYPLALEDISGLPWGATESGTTAGPRFHRGRFIVEEPGNAFLALPGWTKGYVWVNGFNLGRYWNIGPQATLYLPWPLLSKGENELVVLELHPGSARTVELRATPDLGPLDEFTQARG